MNTITLPWLAGEKFLELACASPHVGDYPVGLIPDAIRILVSERCDDPYVRGRDIEHLMKETMLREVPHIRERHKVLCDALDLQPKDLPGAPAVPWDFVELPEGGIGIQGVVQWYGGSLVPCWLYSSHAVMEDANGLRIVAGRLRDKPIDQHNDFMHEWLHAAVAPVPAFVQSYQLDDAKRVMYASSATNELGDDAICGLVGYAIPEVVVAYLAGEMRETETGLPVLETPRMIGLFLEFAQDLAHGQGFSDVTDIFRAEGLSQKTRLHLVGACMEALTRYRGRFLTNPTPILADFNTAMTA